MNNLKILLKKNPIATALLVFLAFLLYQPLVRGVIFFNNALFTNLVFEAIWALIILVFIYLISGKETLKFTTKGLGFALKLGWYLILLHIAMGIWFFSGKIKSGASFVPNVGLVLIEGILFLICVGIFEEGLFRGLILNAFLGKNGDSFSGLLKAVLISSLFFGLAHVYPDIINLFLKPETNTFFTYLQMLGKTIQTGLLGFVLAVIYIGNHNFWSIALTHTIVDMGSAGVNILFSNGQIGNYVDAANGGIFSLVYGLLIVLLLPAAIYAFFQLKHIPLPQWGFFKEPWYPRTLKKVKQDK